MSNEKICTIVVLAILIMSSSIVITSDSHIQDISIHDNMSVATVYPKFDYRLMENSPLVYDISTLPRNVSIIATVIITDPDGLDTVICSYRLAIDSPWNEVAAYVHLNYGNGTIIYKADLLELSLNESSSSTTVINIQTWANDTAGNWRRSEEISVIVKIQDLNRNLGETTLGFWSMIGLYFVMMCIVISAPVVWVKKFRVGKR